MYRILTTLLFPFSVRNALLSGYIQRASADPKIFSEPAAIRIQPQLLLL